ncbi:MAG: competence/damage-inducible protein A [Clostridiales bacterium]|nr:competence/damage-inducible protein A [Clostridiales bacterium]
MRAEILSVGTELLLGDIVNTNAQYIARRLADNGVFVYYQTVVGDNPKRLSDALDIAFERADIVIATGGLGPTKDDITKEIGAKFFNRKLVLHEESLKKIEKHFKNMNRKMTDNNRKQAYLPEGCVIFPNANGTAPGCAIEGNNKIFIMLPGPPKEMAPMFEDEVMPYLSKYQDGVLVSKVLRVLGVGESNMEDSIKDLMDFQTNPTIAPYAKDGEAILRITAKARDKNEALGLIAPVEKQIRERLKDNIYGTGDAPIWDVVAKMLIDRKLTIAVAESCTGGMLASRLINYPGISDVFMEGAVTYSNDAKMRRLGVSAKTLKKYGAVSAETAREMAEGIARTANTDIGLSTTGIAGPGGGTFEKPVGLVYAGMYFKGVVKVEKMNIAGNRQNIRNRAVMNVLDFLRRELENSEV